MLSIINSWDKNISTMENKQIKNLRHQIDQCDHEILVLLQKRMKLVDSIGIQKKEQSMSIYQPLRWKQMLTQHLTIGKSLNLSSEFIKKVFNILHQEAMKRQSEI